MTKYLKSHQYYADLYDRHTVDECRRIERLWGEKEIEKPNDIDITKEQVERIMVVGKEWQLHFAAGGRYLNRDKTIREWMERDEKR